MSLLLVVVFVGVGGGGPPIAAVVFNLPVFGAILATHVIAGSLLASVFSPSRFRASAYFSIII